MAKHIVEVQCPEGYKPVYDECTKTIQIIPDNIRERVKSVDDALSISKLCRIDSSNPSINALHEMQAVLDVLNEGHKFDLIEGEVWYPWVRFYAKESTPRNAKVIKDFCYKGEIYSLVGGDSYCGFNTGLGNFDSSDECGYCNADVGFTACKDTETALYVSEQFGQLVFEACFLRHFDCDDFRWLQR